MNIWLNLMLGVQLLTALVMIGLVLVQHGKGADMGASFGGGSSGSLFGATGSANFLSRSTAVCAAVFFACTLGLAYFGNLGASTRNDGGGSVFDRAGAASAPAAASAPQVGRIPTAPVAPIAASAPAAPAVAASPATPSAAVAPAAVSPTPANAASGAKP